jgi:hypothetical protein
MLACMTMINTYQISGEVCLNTARKDGRGPRLRSLPKSLSSSDQNQVTSSNNAATTGNSKLFGANRASSDDEILAVNAPKLGTESISQWEGILEATNQSYMKLFSPVKKKQSAKPISLGEKKTKDTGKESIPQLKAIESATNTPILPNDPEGVISQDSQTRKGERNRIHKGTTSPIEETSISLVDLSMSNIRGVVTEDATRSNSPTTTHQAPAMSVAGGSNISNDRRLLSEIRSVRAKVMREGNQPLVTRGNLATFAPYMPNRVRKATPGKTNILVGKTLVNEQKVTDPKLRILEKAKVEETLDESGDENGGDSLRDITNEESTATVEAELEMGTEFGDVSFEGDIWMVEGKGSRRSQKRKNTTPEDMDESLMESVTSSDFGDSLSSDITSKARKPGLRTDNFKSDNGDDSFSEAPRLIWKASPALNKGLIKETLQNVGVVGILHDSLSPGSSSEDSSHTLLQAPMESNESSSNLRSIVMDIQMTFKEEIERLRGEMNRKLHAQDVVIDSLRDEIQMIKEENLELRNQLQLSRRKG